MGGGGGAPAKRQSALSLKRHLFPHGDRVKMLAPGLFAISSSTLPPISNIFSNFSSSALKRHLLKRRLTLSDPGRFANPTLAWFAGATKLLLILEFSDE